MMGSKIVCDMWCGVVGKGGGGGSLYIVNHIMHYVSFLLLVWTRKWLKSLLFSTSLHLACRNVCPLI